MFGGNCLVYRNVCSDDIKGSNLNLNTDRTYKSHRGIIIGFDPGLTVGIAILDLSGNLLSLNSFKEISRSEIVSHIISYGNAVLVATDVQIHPKTVRKLATTLNSKIWSPYRSMSVESKIYIVDSYFQGLDAKNPIDSVPKNAHERDALAAAIKTYKDHLNKFRQIKKHAERAELDQASVETVKVLVINGVSIKNAIEQVSEANNLESIYLTEQNRCKSLGIAKDDGKSVQLAVSNPNSGVKNGLDVDMGDCDILQNPDKEMIIKLKNKIKSQKRHINALQQKNIILDDKVLFYQKKVSKLQSKLDKLHNHYKTKILLNKELTSKIATINRLQKKYNDERTKRYELEEKINSTRDIDAWKPSGNSIPVKIIEFFTREGIKESVDRWKIKKGDVVLLKNSEGGGSNTASMIIDLGVKAVITIDKISDPAQHELNPDWYL